MNASESNQTVRAYEHLRSEVQSCRIAPGSRINVAVAAHELDASPGAVREALSRLTAEGLVVSEQNRGFRAADLLVEDFAKLTDARLGVDALCLRSSLASGDIEWEVELLAACHRVERRIGALDGSVEAEEAYAEAHAAFHRALVAGCDNKWLLWMHDLLYTQGVRYRRLCIPLVRDKPSIHAFQGEFIGAVLRRDADVAVQMLSAYYQTARDMVIDALAQGASNLEALPAVRTSGLEGEAGVVKMSKPRTARRRQAV